MDTKTLVGVIAGILTAVSSLPQIIKILREKKVEAVSPVMFFVLLVGNGMWCWYGVLLGDWPIILTNAFSCVCAGVMILLNYSYSRS